MRGRRVQHSPSNRENGSWTVEIFDILSNPLMLDFFFQCKILMLSNGTPEALCFLGKKKLCPDSSEVGEHLKVTKTSS